ncbi:hypothetical protein POVWA2_094720 [Plasmodium ovale wallikeri]|uniref:PIR Superfamily Protein n=1 Tax=Plasmodium ovale wallikeri TaxID=864142 RepID=A0A1A9ASU7_PLAOA|nr:hypothetical protein POVWA1_063230 [Plasmodium ovale wallikeri]SBT59319.1 hypothetical protein POVWA2_094720 [Plasmodium ovale wallikeri]
MNEINYSRKINISLFTSFIFSWKYPFFPALSLNDINSEGNAERITDNTAECTKYIKALKPGNKDYMNICSEFLKNLNMLTLLQVDAKPRTCVYCKNWIYEKIQ